MKNNCKKIFVLLLAISVMAISGCKKDDEKNTDTDNGGMKVTVQNATGLGAGLTGDKAELTVEEFSEKVEGCWGYKSDSKNWQVLRFTEGKLDDFTYMGHMWISGADITEVKQETDNSVSVKITYHEVAYGDDPVSPDAIEVEYLFKTNDDFENSLISVGKDEEFEYIYLGTWEEAMEYMDKNA